MHFDEYQELAMETAIYPDKGRNFIYPVLGLCGEAGEVAEKVKKVIRDHNGRLSKDTIDAIKRELSDCCWYLAAIATELGLSLDDVAQGNLAKLKDRKERGVLGGSGDLR